MISFPRRNKRSVGLDIGSGFVKLAVIDHSGPQPELVHLSHTPLFADAIVEGEVMDPQLVVQAVKTLLDGAGLKLKSVVTSVGGRDVIVKRILMDRMKEAEAREVIRWEAEQYVPFDMENVQLDFQILDPLDDGLQMNVLLVAAKRDLVEQRVSLLRDAGVGPSIIDVDAFALHNAFAYNYPEAMEGTSALVNVGHEVSTVNISQGGVPVLTRDLPFGSRRLREELRRTHRLSADEAEAVVEGRSDQAGEYAATLAEGGEELAVGIERAAAFLSMGEGDGARLGRVFLCGGGASIPGLVETVAARLGTRTEIANPLQRLRVRPGTETSFPVGEMAPMLMLPVGLALRPAA
ncbi:MAG: type IV pilus assembly protein PilM [Gemmatimonadota bacterium]|nr:type IV pilus assembly protein PilM [Gemmatimonadota bacterium]